MHMDIIEGKNGSIAVVTEHRIDAVADAMDLLGDAMFAGHTALVLCAADIAPEFFQLRTGLAGEILQKFTNYHMRAAIWGDISAYTKDSKSLGDFIYESNQGSAIFFVPTLEEALSRLC